MTKCHDSATTLPSAAGEPSAAGAEPPAKPVRVDEVREGALSVDLDDREQLAEAGLELRVAGDVDDLELERELGSDSVDDLERSLAERAAVRGVDPDDRYG